MDVLWFFKKRVAFVEQLFQVSAAPYLERKGLIERGDDPYAPQHSEDPEPPFLTEWLEAHESLQALAHTCLSMLAASLKLYFKAWQREAGYPIGADAKVEFSKSRWLHGYRVHFLECVGVDIAQGPVPFDLLQEVVLVRNRLQHPESIVLSQITYSLSDLKKLKHPFFLDESERGLFTDDELPERGWFMEPSIHVPPEKLLATIASIEEFAEWFEKQALQRLYGN